MPSFNHSMFTLTALAILAASSAQATVLPRQGSAPWCTQLKNQCVQDVHGATDRAFAYESCVFGAACYEDPDTFLAAFQADNQYSSAPPPYSCCIPRVTDTVFNAISADGNATTQQNFINGFYSTLTPSNGPQPTDVSLVISYYNEIADWTGFCSGGIPRQNFGDYFQYSASHSARVCSVYTPPTISSNATCQKMFTTCASQIDVNATDAWSHPACVYGATCFDGQHPVASFLATVWEARNQGQISSTTPAPVDIPRVPQAWFEQIAPSGQLSQQNWID